MVPMVILQLNITLKKQGIPKEITGGIHIYIYIYTYIYIYVYTEYS